MYVYVVRMPLSLPFQMDKAPRLVAWSNPSRIEGTKGIDPNSDVLLQLLQLLRSKHLAIGWCCPCCPCCCSCCSCCPWPIGRLLVHSVYCLLVGFFFRDLVIPISGTHLRRFALRSSLKVQEQQDPSVTLKTCFNKWVIPTLHAEHKWSCCKIYIWAKRILSTVSELAC